MWLPSWPIQRLRRSGAVSPASPAATVATAGGARRLQALCPQAAAAGLWPGQTLAEARALCPALAICPADPEADGAALGRLAHWCERFTPLAAADPPEGLWLDITGCAELFGGEAGLAGTLAALLSRDGLSCQVAVAGTAGAAWALARAGKTAGTNLPSGQEAEALAALPVALLRLDARSVSGLRALGVRRIGELARLERAALTARFGAGPRLRLDQALGNAAEAIAWPHPPAPWAERLAFAEPIGTEADLSRVLALLAKRLGERLAAARLGGVAFTATFFRVDDARPTLGIGAALPLAEPERIAALLRLRLEGLDPGFGVEAVLLEATATAPLAQPQLGLPGIVPSDPALPERALAAVVDELANRLGTARLWRPAPRASHVPERAVRHLPPLAPSPPWSGAAGERPLRLLARPEPIEATAPLPDQPPLQFRWRGGLHRVRAASGPERIAAEWWQPSAAAAGRPEADLLRDYYRVEDSEGNRFWVFRAGLDPATARWFLHGLFP